jgi:diguanylate cyclase (GGDEF)-like protein
MRAAIEAEPIMIDGKSIGVTVSVGVSQLHREETVESLMARADHALYEAKNSGRNVVRLAA